MKNTTGAGDLLDGRKFIPKIMKELIEIAIISATVIGLPYGVMDEIQEGL